MKFFKRKLFQLDFRQKYLRKLFISYMFLIFVPVIIVGSVLYSYSKNIINEEVSKSVMDLLDQTNNIMDGIITDAQSIFFQTTLNRIAVELTESPQQFFNSYEGMQRVKDVIGVFQSMSSADKYIDSLWIYMDNYKKVITTNSGVISFDELGFKSWINDGFGKGAIVEWMTKEEKSVLGDTERKYVSFRGRFPTFANQRNDMVLLNLNVDNVNEMISRIKVRETGYVIVTDSRGRILFSKNKELFLKDIGDIYKDKEFLSKDTGYSIGKVDGQSMLVVYNTIKKTGWKELAFVPLNEITNKIDVIKEIALIVAFLTIMIAFFYSLFISKKIYMPMELLVKSMQKVENGNIEVFIDNKRKDEFGYLYGVFNNMIRRINELLFDTYKLKLLHAESELKALQAQINPHFLYNTLNSMYCMAKINGAQELCTMIYKLTEYFRIGFDTDRDEIEIEEEIKHIGCYYDIQKVRYADRLNITYNIEDGVSGCEIMRFSLQPFVENSILHGMKGNNKTLNLTINGRIEGGTIKIEIMDDGVGISEDKLERIKAGLNDKEPETEYFALRNINNRLKLFYGGEYGISITSKEDEGTTVTVTIPGKGLHGEEYV